MTYSDRVLRQTRQDLEDDFAELGWLLSDLQRKVERWERAWKRTRKQWGVERQRLLLKQADQLLQGIKRWHTLVMKFDVANTDEAQLQQLMIKKQTIYEGLRQLTSLTAGLLTSSEWQSPSFNASTNPQAGNQLGKVTGHITDYTRDQLIVGNAYQKDFAKTFVGSWRTLPIEVLLTNSGMAALTTVITFLLRQHKLTRTVLVGKHSYFENKELLLRMLPIKIIEVEETETELIQTLIKEELPSAIFLDTICNTAGLPMPNVTQLIRFMVKHCTQETYLVLDNTWASLGFRPLKALQPWRGKVKLMVWESMNKYYQYGMDRTIGGFVWGLPQDMSKLFYARIYSGTIMNDLATAVLPTPDDRRLTKRLNRLGQNALYVARELQAWKATHTSKLAEVAFPHLSNHQAFSFARHYPFVGSSLTLTLHDRYQKPRYYKEVVKKMMRLARQLKVPLVEGTSFGLPTTRIYVVAMHTDFAKPFLRLSVGTETRFELDKLVGIMTEALT